MNTASEGLDEGERSERVLVLAPTGKDGPLTVSFLSSNGIASELCRDMMQLISRAVEAMGVLLLAEEGLNSDSLQALIGWLGRQPSWSDIPIIIVTGTGEASDATMKRLNTLITNGNVTFLERPFRPVTLVATVQVALRSRRRQYEVRDLIQEREKGERRFRALAEAVPSVVWSAAADGTITWANQQWYDYTGLARQQNPAEWPRLVLHPDDYERCLQHWKTALSEGTNYTLEVRHRRSDGQYRWFLSKAVPVRDKDGHVQGWFGSTTDIDSQKRNEGRIMHLNKTLVSVLEAIPDVVFVTGFDGSIDFRNSAATQFMRSAGLESLPPAIQSELEHVLQTREHHLPTDFKDVHRFVIGKQERFFLNRIVPMTSHDESTFGAVAMLQDVTEFRLLDEVKTNLIATVSHEFKTPITGVLTALIVLLENTYGPLNGKQVELLSIARSDTERLLRTLHSLLDLTRFEHGAGDMHWEIKAPEALVRAAVEDLDLVASTANVTIRTDLEPDLPLLRVDPERIRHVLTSFLTNAIKYSSRGAEVLVRVQRQGREVCFSVVDYRPTVAQRSQTRMFEKFHLVPDPPAEGAGLGLLIAREFVHAHHGSIGARTEPGIGSEFYFTLPIGAEVEQSDEAAFRASTIPVERELSQFAAHGLQDNR